MGTGSSACEANRGSIERELGRRDLNLLPYSVLDVEQG